MAEFTPADSAHAPDHFVGLVAATSEWPDKLTGPPAARWSDQARRVADEIWSAAWAAGATTRAGLVVAVETER